MRCDPFALATSYIDRLRSLEEQAKGMLDGIPGTLDDLLNCLVFGTADRAASPDQLDALSLESLRGRVRSIFKAVELGTSGVEEDLGIARSRDAVATGLSVSGLWLTHGTANTFYGLAIARTNQAVDDAAIAATLTAQGREAIAAIRDSLAILNGPQGDELLRTARLFQQEVCPQIEEISAGLEQMAAAAIGSRNLSAAYCDGVDILQKVKALLAMVPNDGLGAVLPLLQSTDELSKVMSELTPVQSSLESAVDVLSTFEDEFSAGGYIPETEQRYLQGLAQQLADICEQIAALAGKERYAEMAQLGPHVQEVGALIIDYLQRPPEQRLVEIQQHPAATHFQDLNRRFSETVRARDGASLLDELRNGIPAAIVRKSNELEGKLQEFEEYFATIDRFGHVIESAGEEFIGLSQETVNALCTGALRLFLQKVGYGTLSKIFAEGVFGQLPTAVFQAMTTANNLMECIRGLIDGTSQLGVLPASQRFALERASELLRAAERVDNEVAAIAASLDQFGRQPPRFFLDSFANVIETNMKAGLRDVGSVSAKIQGTTQTIDGFLKANDPSNALPPGFVTDSKGYLKLMPGRKVPDGYTVTPDGHVRVAV